MLRSKQVFFIALLFVCAIVLSGCFKKEIGPQKMEGYAQKNYHSDKYGFSLSFPDGWLGNFSVVEEMQNDITVLSFAYNGLPGQEYPLFRLAIYPFETWQNFKNNSELVLNQQVFAYTNNYVFVLIRTLDNPYSSPQMEQFIILHRGVNEVIGSFKIDSGKEFKLNKFKVFFSNNKLNPEMLDCRLVYPMEVAVSGTLPYEEQVLRALFAGPNDAQQEAGFQSFFNSSTARILRSVKVVENVALVNLKDLRTLIPNANSSCGSAQFLAQIENTLKQFPHVYQVYMAIDEDPSRIYEWLQLGCTEMNFYCDKTPFKSTVAEVDGTKIETPTVSNATTIAEEEKVSTSTLKNNINTTTKI